MTTPCYYCEDNTECDVCIHGKADADDIRAGFKARAELAAREEKAVGWLYYNPDTGIEFSKQHPVRSGECEDAKNVRAATADELLDELKQAWEVIEEERTAEAKMGARYADANSELAQARAELAAARKALEDIALAQPMWDGGVRKASYADLDGCIAEMRNIARAALMKGVGDE